MQIYAQKTIIILTIISIFNNTYLFSYFTSADLSCTTPLVFETSGTILLDSDVSITDTCALIVAGSTFGISGTDVVVFTSTTGNKVVITPGATWNPATFNTASKKIRFMGNAVLAINQGGILMVPGILELLGATLALYQGATIWLQAGTVINNGTIAAVPSED